jgi:hypothetical protein
VFLVSEFLSETSVKVLIAGANYSELNVFAQMFPF